MSMPRPWRTLRPAIGTGLTRPVCWFWLSLLVMLPLQLVLVAQNPWFTRLPKPIGDGVDYENIAYALYHGQGFLLDNQDPQWRRPYEQQAEAYAVHLAAPPRRLAATGRPPLWPLMIASVYACLGRGAVAFATVRLFSATCLAVAGAIATGLTCWLARERLPAWAVAVACATTLLFQIANRTWKDYANDFLTEPLALLLTELLVLLMVCRWPRQAAVGRGQATEAHRRGSGRNRPCESTAPPARLLASGQRRSGQSESGQSESAKVEACSPLPPASWSSDWLIGLVLAAMILTRSVFVVWLPGILLLLVVAERWRGSGWPKLWSSLLRVGGAVLILCAPWWGHNVVVLQRWMPLGTQGPITLVGGYCDQAFAAGGDWQFEPEQALRGRLRDAAEFQAAENDTEREVLVAEAAGAEVRHWISQHPWLLPQLAWRRMVTHWNPYSGRSLLWKAFFVLGGLWLLSQADRRQRAAAWCMLGLLLLSTLVTALLYSTGGRFLLPLYGVLFTLSGLGAGAVACTASRFLSATASRTSTCLQDQLES